MDKAFTGVIKGRVQGVGFRYFTQKRAMESGLTGWVRNLPDGSVEVTAKGPVAELERFMQSLKEGPIGSRVDETRFHWLEEREEFHRFEIRG